MAEPRIKAIATVAGQFVNREVLLNGMLGGDETMYAARVRNGAAAKRRYEITGRVRR